MEFFEYIILLLSQFAGGPGPAENNLMRFGLPTVLWAALLIIAWSRQRQQELPREKLLVWGFALGFGRELFMFGHISGHIISGSESTPGLSISEPLEHTLAMAAVVVIAAAFLRYILQRERTARHYLLSGLASTAVCLVATAGWWVSFRATHPMVQFHQTWAGWAFHVVTSLVLIAAVILLTRVKDWLRNVVSLALIFFFLGEFLTMVNFFTDKAYALTICPITNTFHILGIPILGYVYLKEQAIEKKQVDRQLELYREHLEEMVSARTAQLTTTNELLQREIIERKQIEKALELLSHQNEMILKSAGEGIVGVNLNGVHTFVNPAASRMLGYAAEELRGKPSHATWHHTREDGSPYPETECPLHSGYKSGRIHQGSDQVFWRKDGTSFPASYMSAPIFEKDRLIGAVVVFQDITERKHVEAEIARRNAELAAQNAIAGTISQSLELDMILNAAMDTVLSVLGMEAGCIFLLEEDGPDLVEKLRRGQMACGECGDGVEYACSCWRVSAQAVAEMRPVILDIADYETNCHSPFVTQEGLQTLVGTPLICKGRAVGALTLGARRTGIISPEGLDLLTAIGQQIGVAVENARLYVEAERWAEELTLLHEVSLFLTSTFDPVTIYEQMTEQAAILLDCPVAHAFRWDPEYGHAVGVCSYGANGGSVQQAYLFPSSSPLLSELLTDRCAIPISDGQHDGRIPEDWVSAFHAQALLCLPIWSTEEPLGFLFLIDRRPRRWRPAEIKLIESFVNRAAVALENAYLHKRVERTVMLEERQRIAADMHDGLAQTLSYLGHRADETIAYVANNRQQQAVDELQRMRAAISQASLDVRRSIASLQENVQARRSLCECVEDLIGEFAAITTRPIELCNGLSNSLYVPPADLEQVLRIVREALLNTVRHAGATRIAVHLNQLDQECVIVVEDDGRGFNPIAPVADGGGHFGLIIMRARAARLGGHLSIDSTPGQGARVMLTWSLK